MDEGRAQWESEMLHERASLDFVNSVSERTSDRPVERIATFRELVRLGVLSGLVDEAGAAALVARTSEREGIRIVGEAHAFREELYSTFSAIAAGEVPPAGLGALQRALAEAQLHRRLERSRDGRFVWTWAETTSPRLMLWKVAVDAVDLLTGEELPRLRSCPECLWLFLDQSRNRSRRWCDMSTCGNRFKVRQFHQRQREGEASVAPRARASEPALRRHKRGSGRRES